MWYQDRCQQIVHARNLLAVQARDIEFAVDADVKHKKRTVHHAHWFSIGQFNDEAG